MVVMEEGESLQRAQRHVAAEVLWVVGVAGDEEVGQRAVHDLEDDPVAVAKDEGLDAVDDRLALVGLHERYFVQHHVAFLLIARLHQLQRAERVVDLPLHFEHLCKPARAQFMYWLI